ncbi:MAG: STAS domain-containing protein [Elusimicrobiota bacterium]
MKNLIIEERESEFSKEITVLYFHGSLDVFCIEDISQKFDNLISEKKYQIIAEMSDVDFISSPAVGQLMGCRKRLCENGGNLVLVGLIAEIRNKLNLMGANKIFVYFSNERNAVLKFQWENKVRTEAISVEIPPKLEYVPPARELISRISLCKEYSRRDAFRIETIVDEMCNNAVEHTKETDGPILVKGIINRQKITLDFINCHSPYDTKFQRNLRDQIMGSAEISLDIKRGRGVELVKMLCDEFKVEVNKNQTVIHLTKVREE